MHLVAGLAAERQRVSELDGAAIGGRCRIESRVVAAQQRRPRCLEGRGEQELIARLAIAQRREAEPAVLAGQQHEIRLPVAVDILRRDSDRRSRSRPRKAPAPGIGKFSSGMRRGRVAENARIGRPRSVHDIDFPGKTLGERRPDEEVVNAVAVDIQRRCRRRVRRTNRRPARLEGSRHRRPDSTSRARRSRRSSMPRNTCTRPRRWMSMMVEPGPMPPRNSSPTARSSFPSPSQSPLVTLNTPSTETVSPNSLACWRVNRAAASAPAQRVAWPRRRTPGSP